MKIAKKYLKLAKTNQLVIARLIKENSCSYSTAMRWLTNNCENLTTALNLKILCEELNVSQEEILDNKLIK